MTYNVLIVKNRYTKKLNLSKYLDWFSTATPLTIHTEELVTDFDVTSMRVSNATYQGVICDNDLLLKLRTIVPEYIYHSVVFICGNELNGIRVSATNQAYGTPLYPQTEIIQLAKVDDQGKTLNHELFHAFTAKARRFGAPIIDQMDTYFLNNDLSLTDTTNRTIQLRLLAPYWEQVVSFKPMQGALVTITRNCIDGKETLGTLHAEHNNATFTCKTLELPWFNNTKNISCIPTGTYQVRYTLSPKLLKYTYEVQAVPNRTGIRIHSANYYGDLLGCIALGNGYADLNKDGELDVVNSKNTIASFEGFMQKQSFTLVIA